MPEENKNKMRRCLNDKMNQTERNSKHSGDQYRGIKEQQATNA
jgi:hypothetical protein